MSASSRGVLVVGQSGGPTPVINASLAGVIEQAGKHDCFTAVYGLVHGIEGALKEMLLDLTVETAADLELLARTPASALGSCRHKLADGDYDRILDVFKAHDVRYFVYMGGNDSMDTCHRIAALSAQSHHEMRVMGVPKTIDNDLTLTDHSPGYGSAARFLALATRDTGRDLESMATFDDVVILEAMGRNAGWLAAASALGRNSADEAPHLVCVPEIPFDEDAFLAQVGRIHGELGRVYVVVSEGIRDAGGRFVGEQQGGDAFGHAIHALGNGAASWLAALVRRRLGLQARFLRPGLIGRAMSSCVSEPDRREARLAGRAAVDHLARGHSGSMITIERVAGRPYASAMGAAPLKDVANSERLMPRHHLDEAGSMTTESFREYALPLIGGPLPPLARLSGGAVPPRRS